jgi:hypothetical protein
MNTMDQNMLNESLKRAVLSIESNTDKESGRVQPIASVARSTAQRAQTVSATPHNESSTSSSSSSGGAAAAAAAAGTKVGSLLHTMRHVEQQLRVVFNQFVCVAGATPQNESQAMQRFSEQMGALVEQMVLTLHARSRVI